MNLDKLVASFKEMVGWPYKSPGTNDKNGVDCSGAFVYAYKQQGESIYHGSNRIIRMYCRDIAPVTTISALKLGMVVFKSRSDLSRMKAEYKPGGKYYNPDLPLDYYHMGLVTSINPLNIVNATEPEVKISTTLTAWSHAGYLTAVNYGSTPVDDCCAELNDIIAQLHEIISKYQ